MKNSFASPFAFSASAALLLLAAACSGPAPKRERLEVVSHLMAEPEGPLERQELFEARPVMTWTFDDQAELDAWVGNDPAAQGLESWRLEERGARAKTSRDKPWLAREADLDAAAVHAVEAVFLGTQRFAAELCWAGPGDDFSARRCAALEVEDVPMPRARFRFEIATHREWRGKIGRLRLSSKSPAGHEFALAEISALRYEPRAEALAAKLAKSFKIDLDADVRSAWLAAPGTLIERRAQIGEGQSLSFAYGLEGGVRESVVFSVEAKAQEGEPLVIFEKTVDPRDGAGSWWPATVDLEALAGREVELRFKTRVAAPNGQDAPPDLAYGFALWAHPAVLGRAPAEDRPNVVLISLDTLRPDRLSAYGHDRETSPRIDAWARRAVLFENTVVQAPWTLPSHASLFTGWEAVRHGMNQFGTTPARLEMLAEVLREAGYTTAAITGGGYLRPQFGFSQGFDHFRYWPRILAREELESGMKHTFEWLEANHHRRFFLFFHTYEIHYPHRRREPHFTRLASNTALSLTGTQIQMRPRQHEGPALTWAGDHFLALRPGEKEWAEGLNEAEEELVASMYDSAIAFTDEHLGRLFDRLEDLGLMENTLIVLTSDHGEALGEEGLAGHNYLDEHNLMVPLIISFPDGLGAGRRIPNQVRSIDVMPTLLEEIGLARGPEAFDGVSLSGLIRGQDGDFPDEAWSYASSANYGLALRYKNRLKYIYNNTAWRSLQGREELFDLVPDPAERRDLAATHPQTPALRERVAAYMESHHEGLRLEIANASTGRLTGKLIGAWADHAKVKAVDPDCACFEWVPGGAPRITLESGQRTALYFEAPGSPTVTLEGSFIESDGQPRAAFSQTVELADLEEPLFFVLDGDAFERRTAEHGHSGDFTGFELWRRGGDLQTEAPSQDPRLLEQLRALGYVQ